MILILLGFLLFVLVRFVLAAPFCKHFSTEVCDGHFGFSLLRCLISYFFGDLCTQSSVDRRYPSSLVFIPSCLSRPQCFGIQKRYWVEFACMVIVLEMIMSLSWVSMAWEFPLWHFLVRHCLCGVAFVAWNFYLCVNYVVLWCIKGVCCFGYVG